MCREVKIFFSELIIFRHTYISYFAENVEPHQLVH